MAHVLAIAQRKTETMESRSEWLPLPKKKKQYFLVYTCSNYVTHAFRAAAKWCVCLYLAAVSVHEIQTKMQRECNLL